MRWSWLIRPVWSVLDGLLDRVLCVLGAVAFSQVPEFIQQYLQRLGGHLDEARRQLAQFQESAARSGLTLGQLIEKTSANAEPAVARLGGVMQGTAVRVDELTAADAAIRHASVWTRPLVFLRHLDFGIARATWGIFRPAVPTTPEGLLYAGLGALGLLAVYRFGVIWPVRRARRARAAQKSRAAAGAEPGGDVSRRR
jgi:hypothetical protein